MSDIYVTDVPRWVLATISGVPNARGVFSKRVPLIRPLSIKDCPICFETTREGERRIFGGRAYHKTCFEARAKELERQRTSTSCQCSECGFRYGNHQVGCPEWRSQTGGYSPFPVVLNSASDRVPRGNLGDFEYRYWIGTELAGDTWGMCRCCRLVVAGSNNRNMHKIDAKHKFQGVSCCALLDEAYAELRSLGKCVICKQQTSSTVYDVPLCSEYCIRQWKFQSATANLPLTIELSHIKSALMEADKQRHIANPNLGGRSADLL